MPKIIRILSGDHVPWRFCIQHNREHKLRTLKVIFSMFRAQIPDLQIVVSRPIIVQS